MDYATSLDGIAVAVGIARRECEWNEKVELREEDRSEHLEDT